MITSFFSSRLTNITKQTTLSKNPFYKILKKNFSRKESLTVQSFTSGVIRRMSQELKYGFELWVISN